MQNNIYNVKKKAYLTAVITVIFLYMYILIAKSVSNIFQYAFKTEIKSLKIPLFNLFKNEVLLFQRLK